MADNPDKVRLMKRKRHTTDVIIRKLREPDQLAAGIDAVRQLCQKREVSVQTLGRCRQQFRGTGDDEIKCMRQLEEENRRLRKAVVDLSLDRQILTEIQVGKHDARSESAIDAPTSRHDMGRPILEAMTRTGYKRPRAGYRVIHGRLQDEGFEVGRYQVYRLYPKHRLSVPLRRRNRSAIGVTKYTVHLRSVTRRNDVWTWDFLSNQTINDGRTSRVLTVVDEYTRECLLVLVSRRINLAEVMSQLQILFSRHGMPRHIRSDNGPEFMAKRLRGHLKEHRVETLSVEPGCPLAERDRGELQRAGCAKST